MSTVRVLLPTTSVDMIFFHGSMTLCSVAMEKLKSCVLVRSNLCFTSHLPYSYIFFYIKMYIVYGNLCNVLAAPMLFLSLTLGHVIFCFNYVIDVVDSDGIGKSCEIYLLHFGHHSQKWTSQYFRSVFFLSQLKVVLKIAISKDGHPLTQWVSFCTAFSCLVVSACDICTNLKKILKAWNIQNFETLYI